jgi:hypothetical protein
MPTQPTKPSTFLLFPWGLMSIVIILVLNLTLRDEWFSKNWSWIALVLIIPAAILENFKVGYSTMRIMFLKVVFSLLSFLLVGMAFGSALTQYYNKKFVADGGMIKAINLPCIAGIGGTPDDPGSPVIQYAESKKSSQMDPDQ